MQKSRLDKLLDYLIEESNLSIKIPEDEAEKRNLFRALRNVREPKSVSEEFLKLQDEELQMQLSEKGIVTIDDIALKSSLDERLNLWQGDITRLKVDAIVNAANSGMLGCFQPMHNCIDNAIHTAAGIQLREACNEMMIAQGYPEPTGEAKITKGYNLPAKHVIHTVGPIVSTGIPTIKHKIQLKNCYEACLKTAVENELSSIVFCCISTGVFSFPNREAAEIAVKTCKEFLENHNLQNFTIIFNVFKDIDLEIYKTLLKINDSHS